MRFILGLLTLGLTIHASLGQSSSSTGAPPTTTERPCGDPCDEIKNIKKEFDSIKQWIETTKTNITNLQAADAEFQLKFQQIHKDIDSYKRKLKVVQNWSEKAKEVIAELQTADINLEKQNAKLQEEINVIAFIMVWMLKRMNIIPQNYDFNGTGISGLGDLQNLTTLAPEDMTTVPGVATPLALEDSTDEQEVTTKNPNIPTLTASYLDEKVICLDNETVGITQNEDFIFSTCGNTRAVFIFNAKDFNIMLPVKLELPTGAVIADIAYGKSYDGYEILLLAVILRNEIDNGFISKLMSVNITDTGLDDSSLTTLQTYNFNIKSTTDKISLSTFEHPSGITLVQSVFNTTLSVISLGEEISDSYDKSLEEFGSPLQLFEIESDDYIITTTDGKIYHAIRDSIDEEPYTLTTTANALYSAIYRITTPVQKTYILVALDDTNIVYIDEDLTQEHNLLTCQFPPHVSGSVPYRISVYGSRLLVASTNGYMLIYDLLVNVAPGGIY